MKHWILLAALSGALLAMALLLHRNQRPPCSKGSVEALFTDCERF